MKRLFALLVAAAVVVGTVPVGAAVASPADLGVAPGPAQTGTDGTETGTPAANATATPDGNGTVTDAGTNGSNGTTGAVEPGAQLAGALAVQRTEVESEVGARAFGQRVAAAATNDSKAAVVAGEINDSRERLTDLRERLDELEAAREAGEISEGRFRAEAARVGAEIGAIERRLERSNETAASLPPEVREANGIDASSIERLRTEARNLSGPEVAEIARSIGGNGAGRGLGDDAGPPEDAGEGGPPEDAGEAGPPEDRGNGSGNASQGPPEDRGNGNDSGDDGEGPPGDRGNGDGDAGNPQESEANRNDRENEGNGNGGSGDGNGDGNEGNGNGAGGGDDAGNGDGSGSDNAGGSGNDNGNDDAGGSGNDNGNDNTGGSGNGNGNDDAGRSGNGNDA